MQSIAMILAAGCILGGGLGIRSILGCAPARALPALGSAAVLGIAFCGFIGPLASLAGLPVPIVTIASLFLLFAICAAKAFARRRAASAAGSDSGARGDIHAWIVIIGLLCWFGWVGSQVPMMVGDEVFVWGYKSAAIHATGRTHILDWAHWEGRGWFYPLAIPVAGSLASGIDGVFDPGGCRVVSLIGYFAFCAAFAELLRLRFRGLARAAALLGFAAFPVVANYAPLFMSDIAFTAALAFALLELIQTPRSSQSDFRRGPLRVALFASLGLLRMEGIPIGAALCCVWAFFSVSRARIRSLAAAYIVTALLLMPWLIEVLRAAPSAGEGSLTIAQGQPGGAGVVLVIFERCARALSSIIAMYCSPSDWLPLFGGPAGATAGFGFIAPALLLILFSKPPGADAAAPRACAAAAIVTILAQVLALAGTSDFERQLPVFRDRAALHLLPAILLLTFGASSAIASFRRRRSRLAGT